MITIIEIVLVIAIIKWAFGKDIRKLFKSFGNKLAPYWKTVCEEWKNIDICTQNIICWIVIGGVVLSLVGWALSSGTPWFWIVLGGIFYIFLTILFCVNMPPVGALMVAIPICFGLSQLIFATFGRTGSTEGTCMIMSIALCLMTFFSVLVVYRNTVKN